MGQFNLEAAVGQAEGCVNESAEQGATTRIQSSEGLLNNIRWHAG